MLCCQNLCCQCAVLLPSGSCEEVEIRQTCLLSGQGSRIITYLFHFIASFQRFLKPWLSTSFCTSPTIHMGNVLIQQTLQRITVTSIL